MDRLKRKSTRIDEFRSETSIALSFSSSQSSRLSKLYDVAPRVQAARIRICSRIMAFPREIDTFSEG